MNRPIIPGIPTPPKKIAGKGKRVMQSALCAYLSVADTSVKKWVKLGLPRRKEGTRPFYSL